MGFCAERGTCRFADGVCETGFLLSVVVKGVSVDVEFDMAFTDCFGLDFFIMTCLVYCDGKSAITEANPEQPKGRSGVEELQGTKVSNADDVCRL